MSSPRAPRLAAALCLVVAAVSNVSIAVAAPPGTNAPATSPTPENGAALYTKYCGLCHGTKLEGYAADNAPSLSSSTFRATASTAFLQAAIERGRAGTAMAGYAKQVGGPLEPTDVDALIAFIRAGASPPAPLAPKASKGNVTKGATVYTTHCETCHGTMERRGNAVHLANAMFLASASDAYLRVAIVEGRPGTAMESWKDKLAGDEIEDVIAYVRSLARPVPPPPPVAAPSAPVAVPPANVVMNPKGAAPTLSLRMGRYASVADVAKAYQEKKRMVLVDARPSSDFARMHIPGALSVPYFDMHDLERVPNDGTWVVAYCVCPHEESGRILEELRKRGYPNTAILDEGFFVWKDQGYPVEVAAGQLPIPAPPSKPAAFAPSVEKP